MPYTFAEATFYLVIWITIYLGIMTWILYQQRHKLYERADLVLKKLDDSAAAVVDELEKNRNIVKRNRDLNLVAEFAELTPTNLEEARFLDAIEGLNELQEERLAGVSQRRPYEPRARWVGESGRERGE
ncbi:MAG: hypothetical protein MMC33_001754 [Icmadophila ericetorum]|nr:hypothetical protein [Icmadophila ericetorum]